MKKVFKGSCLCGEIKFSVDDFSEQVANCHCTMCRKFHGAAYGTLVGVTGLTWLKGIDLLKDFTAENGTTRSFCGVCGSSLGFRVKGAPKDAMELAIATLDEDIPVQVDAQIYVGHKANWCDLYADVPAFPDSRES